MSGEQHPAGSSPESPSIPAGRKATAPRRTMIVVASALAAAALVGIIAVAIAVTSGGSAGDAGEAAGPAAATAPSLTVLEQAVRTCTLSTTDSIVVGDEGMTVTVDGRGDEDPDGASISDTFCLLDATEVSTAAMAQIEGTTSLQGRQSASWGDVDASWTYHPDNGLDLILTER